MHHDLFPVLSVLAIALYELNGSFTAGFIPTSNLPSRPINIPDRPKKYDENRRFRKYRTEHNYEKRNNEESDENISKKLVEWERRREQKYRSRPPNSNADGRPKKIDKDIGDNEVSDSTNVDIEGNSTETQQQEGSEGRNEIKLNPYGEPRKTLTMDSLSGGPNFIFAMARRMLFWEKEDECYDEECDPRRMKKSNGKSIPRTGRMPRSMSSPLPRWHPYDGIADANPSFRMQSPAMNNRGYASTIRRNSRKRGKVSLWRHALRMYDKMKAEELEQQRLININQNQPPSTATILRTTEHFEAACVACAKLGLWREALGIYNEVVEIEANGNRKDVTVTENLVLSLIGSCVRAARMRRKQKFTEEDQRKSLDAVREILEGLEQNHGLGLESRYINPLAAAYQHLGLTVESSDIFETLLLEQVAVAPVRRDDDDDDDDDDGDSVPIIDTGAKDKASYNIMVQSAIMEGNWTTAIDSLRNMTDAGLYPNSRNLNLWSETAKKKESRGGGRRMRSWKKKRERMLVRGTLPRTAPGPEIPNSTP